MIKAVIFDKDGTLMLTEEIYFRTFRDAVKKYGGKREYVWEDHVNYIGTPTTETFLDVRKKFGLTTSFDEFAQTYREGYKKAFEEEGLVPVEGVKELLDTLKKEKIPFAIGTGSVAKSTEFTLRKAGLFEYFDIIVTASDVAKGKPDPETFLLTAKKLRVNPHECLVIGDAINDVLAAKSAGMKIIAITDKSYIEDPDLASPDLEVKEFKDITIEMIKSL